MLSESCMPHPVIVEFPQVTGRRARPGIVCSPADNAVNFEIVTLSPPPGERELRERGLVRPPGLRLVTQTPDWPLSDPRTEDSWIAEMYSWNTRTPRECIVEHFEHGRFTGIGVLPPAEGYG